jgi:hypothetical protein
VLGGFAGQPLGQGDLAQFFIGGIAPENQYRVIEFTDADLGDGGGGVFNQPGLPDRPQFHPTRQTFRRQMGRCRLAFGKARTGPFQPSAMFCNDAGDFGPIESWWDHHFKLSCARQSEVDVLGALANANGVVDRLKGQHTESRFEKLVVAVRGSKVTELGKLWLE